LKAREAAAPVSAAVRTSVARRSQLATRRRRGVGGGPPEAGGEEEDWSLMLRLLPDDVMGVLHRRRSGVPRLLALLARVKFCEVPPRCAELVPCFRPLLVGPPAQQGRSRRTMARPGTPLSCFWRQDARLASPGSALLRSRRRENDRRRRRSGIKRIKS